MPGDEEAQQGVPESEKLAHEASFHGVDPLSVVGGLGHHGDELLELVSSLEKGLFFGQDHGGPPWCR